MKRKNPLHRHISRLEAKLEVLETRIDQLCEQNSFLIAEKEAEAAREAERLEKMIQFYLGE